MCRLYICVDFLHHSSHPAKRIENGGTIAHRAKGCFGEIKDLRKRHSNLTPSCTLRAMTDAALPTTNSTELLNALESLETDSTGRVDVGEQEVTDRACSAALRSAPLRPPPCQRCPPTHNPGPPPHAGRGHRQALRARRPDGRAGDRAGLARAGRAVRRRLHRRCDARRLAGALPAAHRAPNRRCWSSAGAAEVEAADHRGGGHGADR